MTVDGARARVAVVWALLVVICIVGAALRFHRIAAKSLWLDETATMGIVSQPFGGMLDAVSAHDTHPPLYYAVLHAWMWGSSSVTRARALSAVVGLTTLTVFYVLARRLVSDTGALAGTLLLAVSAYQVYFAQEARHYALATCLVAVSWLLLVTLLTRPRGRRWPLWLGLALSNAACLYVFYYTAFAIAAQLVVLLVQWRETGRRVLARWCVWQIVPAGLFAFYLPVVKARLDLLRRVVPADRYGPLTLDELAATASQFACGFLSTLVGASGASVRAGAAVLAIVVLACALVGLKRLRLAVVVGGTWLLVPLAAAAFFPFKGHIYEPKHIVFAAPAVALLLATGFAAAPGKWKAAICVPIVLLLCANGLSLAHYYRRDVEKENWRDAISRLAQKAVEGDILVMNPAQVYLPYQYYYNAERCGGVCPPLVLSQAPTGSKLFRSGELDMGRRMWVLTAASNVAVANSRIPQALRRYPVLFHERYDDLVGRIDLTLYDTRKPSPTPERGG